MRAKIRYAIDQIRTSYWFVPALLAVGGIVLAGVMLRVDALHPLPRGDRLGPLQEWIYVGSSAGAREVLSTLAGSMITVAGVVFSITIVALTLAAAQFGPRVLSSFMSDRGNQTVLGAFIGTFIYCLLVLRATQGDGGGADVAEWIPHLSLTVALVLGVVAIAVLIYFIHHVAVSIQAPHVIASIAEDLAESARTLFPEEVGAAPPPGAERGAPDPPADAVRVQAERSGYIDVMDLRTIMDAAVAADVVVRLEYRPGHFVQEGATLARVGPVERVDEGLVARVRGAHAIGRRRTPLQDVEFPIDQITEIAVRALSPGINDPYTAATGIHHLGAGLCRLARRDAPSAVRLDDSGTVRIVAARTLGFDGAVARAFDPIRQNAAHHVSVYMRLLETITTVIGCASSPATIAVLTAQADQVVARARQCIPAVADLADVEELYARVAEASDRRRAELHDAGGAACGGAGPG